jgi:hypothetical protein
VSALEQLDRVRRDSVERARPAVLAARARVQQAERALQAALQHEQAAERQLTRAGADFASACRVLDLRAAELQLVHAREALRLQRALTLRCEHTHSAANTALAEQERALLQAELGRRAVEGRIAQQAADVGRRTERQREEEAEEVFRATRARGSLA